MKTLEAVREMARESGRGVTRISRDIGRDRTYISSMLARGSVPNADMLASIAEACGYTLMLVGGDAPIIIDGAPDHDDAPDL